MRMANSLKSNHVQFKYKYLNSTQVYDCLSCEKHKTASWNKVVQYVILVVIMLRVDTNLPSPLIRTDKSILFQFHSIFKSGV